MRLELRWSVVDDLVAGPATRLVGRRLEVDVDGLRARLSTDPRLTGVRLDLVHPGERCRIGRVFDVVAPRAKLDGGEDFPGVLGSVARAGQGTTLALEGVAVVATDQQTDSVGTLAVIDMAGPNAELSAFGRTRNLVITAWPAPAIERSDYLAAVRLAALKTAVYLARTAREAQPDRVEVFELPPSSRVPPELAHLPRVAYVFQIHSHQRPTGIDEGILYGDPGAPHAADDRASERGARRRRAPRLHGPERHHLGDAEPSDDQGALRPARPHAVVRGRGRHGRAGDRARARALGVPRRRPRRAHARRRRRRSHQDRRRRAARGHGAGGLAVRGARREDDGGRRGHVDRRQRRGHAALRSAGRRRPGERRQQPGAAHAAADGTGRRRRRPGVEASGRDRARRTAGSAARSSRSGRPG